MPDAFAPVLLVHGGAGDIPEDMVAPYEAGVHAALDAGWAILERGGRALDAVEAAILSMEDASIFDAGRGSILNRDGRVQLDAMLMDGASLRAGGVGAVETIRNPIQVARAILERTEQVYLAGHGAEQFAAEQGFAPITNGELITPREQRRFEEARRAEMEAATGDRATADRIADRGASHDTVGAVAVDRHGDLAAGTSTGGILYKPVGRIGDSSIIGSGCYADNDAAAVSCTGEGEAIMRLVLGKWAVDRVAQGQAPQAAAQAAIERLGSRLDGRGGLILLDRQGRTGVAFNTPRMAWGVRPARRA
jgi:beta-aspartyl-peptidase (threonine type)